MKKRYRILHRKTGVVLKTDILDGNIEVFRGKIYVCPCEGTHFKHIASTQTYYVGPFYKVETFKEKLIRWFL